MPICMKLPICWNNIQEQWNDQKQQAIHFRIFYIFLFRNIWKCNHKNHQTLHWWDRSNNRTFLQEQYCKNNETIKNSNISKCLCIFILKYFENATIKIIKLCIGGIEATIKPFCRNNIARTMKWSKTAIFQNI